jgi:hypothetical protein
MALRGDSATRLSLMQLQAEEFRALGERLVAR